MLIHKNMIVVASFCYHAYVLDRRAALYAWCPRGKLVVGSYLFGGVVGA